MQDIADFRLDPAAIDHVGVDLSRPECVLTQSDGTLLVSDNRGGVTRIAADGRQKLIGDMGGDPNGLAMDREGTIYVANIGDGKLYRLHGNGRSEVVLDRFAGNRLGAVNFAYVDAADRLWITISTVTEPRAEAIRNPRPDGYILRHDADGWRRVAEGFRFTNEIRIDRANRFLYVAESAAGAVARLELRPDGSLGRAEPFGPRPLFEGAIVDGIAFDAAGNLWVTEISRNALIVLKPDGTPVTVFEDPAGALIHFPTSIAFGGEDLRTAYIGSLRMNRLARFRVPFPGLPLRHWR
ncbi:MAG: SMP-30/gluconolactonase/LRE family protein [Reyranellaceae bacterium]